MDRIKNLSLDQKAKLYYMALLQKGMIDTLPEDPKAAYIRDMMGKMEETRDEEDKENDRNLALDDIPDSLREKATELGYLNEESNQYQKVEFVYTEQGGRFYGLDVYVSKDQRQRSDKLRYDEANKWLKDILEYIHEGDLIPQRYVSGIEDLDLIVDRLKELGIEASHNDFMDVS